MMVFALVDSMMTVLTAVSIARCLQLSVGHVVRLGTRALNQMCSRQERSPFVQLPLSARSVNVSKSRLPVSN